jgi:ArsR family transcriptional regulator
MTDTELVRLARAIGDPTRLRILRTIATGGSICCGAITRDVSVRPATISHHLRVLGDAGLVESQRDGQFVHVCVKPERIEQFRAALRGVFDAVDPPGPGRAGRVRRGGGARRPRGRARARRPA